MKYHIPKILLYARLLLAFFVLGISVFSVSELNNVILVIMYIGIITDIFDGIIARKLNVSEKNFRIHDTLIDLFFYISILYYIFEYNSQLFYDNKYLISAIFTLEILMYVISFVKFGKLPSPHALLSKFWGIYIVVEFTLLLLNVNGIHFRIALVTGVFVHIDRVFIYLFLRKWDHDIPTCYHAYQSRKGKHIKRIKLFNG